MDRERWETLTKQWAEEDAAYWSLDASGCWAPPGSEAWTPAATLRQLRTECLLSQRDVAAISGLSQCDVSRIERGGNATWRSLARYAAVLECDLVLRLKPRRPFAEIRAHRPSMRKYRLGDNRVDRKAIRQAPPA